MLESRQDAPRDAVTAWDDHEPAAVNAAFNPIDILGEPLSDTALRECR
jgi:hypothetical protein